MSIFLQVLINLRRERDRPASSAPSARRANLWVAAIVTLGSFALYNGYFILLEWLMNGQTPGKRMLHIRVIKQGGYSLRFFDTLLRNLLRVVDFLPLFYGVGLTSLVLTRDSQRVGDLVAGTLVVYQEPVETRIAPLGPAGPRGIGPAPPGCAARGDSRMRRSRWRPNTCGHGSSWPPGAPGSRGGSGESRRRDQRAGAATRPERRELPGLHRQAIRARSSMVIPTCGAG